MKIYVDFDDVLCETARAFSDILKDMLGKIVPYEKIKFFNLQKSFGLDDAQYKELMDRGHLPEVLLSYKETEGACETINGWIDEGHEVFIVTGRPSTSYEVSWQWLCEHNLSRAKLICVDKYGRDLFCAGKSFSISLEEFYKIDFDFAVEDSPEAFKHLTHLQNCTVAVFDRPWNQNADFPKDNFIRCKNWSEVNELTFLKGKRERNMHSRLSV